MMTRSLKPLLAIILPAALLSLGACNQSSTKNNSTTMTDTAKHAQLPAASAFEQTIDGKQTHLYVLKNKSGAEVAITNYGGRIVSILVPDKTGTLVDVVEGFDSVEGYEKSTEPYFGALIGRFGNRIAKGKFTLDGKEYTLFTNNGANTLHGGKPGFQSVVWDGSQVDSTTLSLTYLAKDMEGGFPGNLHVKVIYHLTDNNGLTVSYEATTDKTTVVNLTSHPFFNLNGAGSGTILDHIVQIHADEYTPVDSSLIPTGKLETVKGTPFDFNLSTTIGARIQNDNQQLKDGKGYDHNFVLSKHNDTIPVATAIGDKTGIEMSVYTEEPGMQFYSGNFMLSKNNMKYGHKDDFRTAFAMETQHFPDAPNQPTFPSTILKPGQVYKTSSEYRFAVVK
jgi:aldose 1-epimerase